MIAARLIPMALVAVLATSSALAQQPGAPLVRAKINPSRVVVGQSAILSIDVLAPNYMPSPPELPDFQIRNLSTRQSGAVNFVEQHGDMTFAGVRYEFTIFPLAAGTYTISDQSVTITYAAEPPATQKATLQLPALNLEAFVPAGAAALKPFIASGKITMTQKVERSEQDLKVGDTLTRTVTITADGIPAMMIPPVTFAPMAGFAIYPSQPVLQDKTDRRSDVVQATRVDQATYLMQQPGDYALPAMELAWWNVSHQTIEHTKVDATTLHVAENPAIAHGSHGTGGLWRRLTEFYAIHWRLLILVALGASILIWNLPGAVRWMLAWRDRRRATYAQSEQFYFSRLRRIAGEGDLRAAYFALLDWSSRFEPLAPDYTLRGLMFAAKDTVMEREIAALEKSLFGNTIQTADLRALMSRLSKVRRHLRRSSRRGSAMPPLLVNLNPVTVSSGIQRT